MPEDLSELKELDKGCPKQRECPIWRYALEKYPKCKEKYKPNYPPKIEKVKDAEICFIGIAPGFNVDRCKKDGDVWGKEIMEGAYTGKGCFTGEEIYRAMETTMNAIGDGDVKYYVTNIYKCPTIKIDKNANYTFEIGGKKFEKPEDYWRFCAHHFLKRELKALTNLKVVITMGRWASEYFGKLYNPDTELWEEYFWDRPIESKEHNPIKLKIYNREVSVLVSLHPRNFSRNINKKIFKNDIISNLQQEGKKLKFSEVIPELLKEVYEKKDTHRRTRR